MNMLLLSSLLISFAILFAAMGLRKSMEWTRASVQALESAQERERRLLHPQEKRKLSQLTERMVGDLSYTKNLQKQLSLADMQVTAAEFLALRTLVSAGIALAVAILAQNPLAAVVVGGLVWYAFGVQVKRKRDKRMKLFNIQMADVLNLLVTSLQAGFGLNLAMASVAEEMPKPASEEFGRVMKEVMYGYSLHEALDHLVERIGSDDLELVVTSIHIQAEVGGNLAEVLQNIAGTIRSRIELAQEIRSMTSEQRYSGAMLAIMPFLLAAVITIINPGYMMELTAPGWPRLIPVAVVVMTFTGYTVMRRMTNLKY